MEGIIYAQLNQENICNGISNLKDEVPEINYCTKVDFDPITGLSTETQVFVSRMIKLSVYSENYLGLKYNEDGTWTKPV